MYFRRLRSRLVNIKGTTVSFFRPLPLLGNPHVQTILGNLLTGRARTLRVARHIVPVADGDHVVLHETPPLAEHPRQYGDSAGGGIRGAVRH